MNGEALAAWQLPRGEGARAWFLAGLVVALIHAGSQIRQSLHVAAAADEPGPARVSAPVPDLSRGSGFAAVADMHLFGVYREPVVVVAPPPVVVPETPLAYRLQGVFTSNSADGAAALISTEIGRAHV